MKRNIGSVDDVVTALADTLGKMDEDSFDVKKANAVCNVANSIVRAKNHMLAVLIASGVKPQGDFLQIKPAAIDQPSELNLIQNQT